MNRFSWTTGTVTVDIYQLTVTCFMILLTYIRFHADMQSAEIYIYTDIICEGEKVHYFSFVCMETIR